MITPRGLITLLLFAVLVPIILIGVANWRGAVQPDPAPTRTAPPRAARPQLGRFPQPWSASVRQAQNAEIAPSHRDQAPPATADEQPLRPYATRLGSWLASAQAMMITQEPDAPVPTRRGEAAPFPGVPVAPPSGAGNGAGSAPAIVEFVAVTQDQQLLQRDEFLAELVKELKIIVWWNVTGSQTQRLELYTPNGSVYKQFITEFNADAAGFEGRAQRGGRTAVETRLPVGGTWITEYALFGTWRVDVYLGEQRTPVTSASVALNR